MFKRTLVIFAALVITGAGCAEKEQVINSVAVGMPCSHTYFSPPMDNKGLQCYFYGETNPEKISKPGIWIQPSIKPRSVGSYSDYLSGWKKYESPDKNISFQYPKVWSVNEKDWKGTVDSEGLIFVEMSPTVLPPNKINNISIEKIKKASSSTLDDIINYQTRGSSTVLKKQLNINDSHAVRLDITPNNTLADERIVLIIENGEYFYTINAIKFNDPLLDFPTEYLLSTIKVRK